MLAHRSFSVLNSNMPLTGSLLHAKASSRCAAPETWSPASFGSVTASDAGRIRDALARQRAEMVSSPAVAAAVSLQQGLALVGLSVIVLATQLSHSCNCSWPFCAHMSPYLM